MEVKVDVSGSQSGSQSGSGCLLRTRIGLIFNRFYIKSEDFLHSLSTSSSLCIAFTTFDFNLLVQLMQQTLHYVDIASIDNQLLRIKSVVMVFLLNGMLRILSVIKKRNVK